MQDLGTFGGNYGIANAINLAGEVVGWASNAGDQAAFAFLWRNMKSRITALMAAMTVLAMLIIPVSRLAHGYTARNNKPAQELDKLIHPRTLMVPLPALASGNQRPAGQAAPTTGCSGSGELSPGTPREIGIPFHYCEVSKSGSRYVLTGWCLDEKTCQVTYANYTCPSGYPAAFHTFIGACKTWVDHQFGCY
jgi:probable HAF family extracellular repeat protein